MTALNRILCPVNLANPVNRASALNKGLLSWWLCLPGLMGGEYLPDLMRLPGTRYQGSTHAQRQTTGADTYTNAPFWGRGTNRPGGFGHMVNPALTSPSGIMQSGDVLGAAGALTFDFTLIGSFIVTVFRDTSDCILGQGNASGGHVFFIVDSTHLLRFSLSTHAFSGTTALVAETWYQAAVTWTAGGGSPLSAIYLNGKLQATSTTQTAADRVLPVGAVNYIFAGNPNTTSARPLNSRFDDFRVFNRALSAFDIRAIYQDSLLGYPETLLRTEIPVVGFPSGVAIRDSNLFWYSKYGRPFLGA